MAGSPLVILLFAGAAQGLLLSIALFFLKRGPRIANRILAVLLFLFTMIVGFHASGQLFAVEGDDAGGKAFGHALGFLFAPLFLLYVQALTIPGFRIRLRLLYHVVPFLAAAWALLILGEHAAVIHAIIPWCLLVQFGVYLLVSFRALRTHQQSIRRQRSSINRITLRWLQILLVAQGIIWPIAFFVELTKESPAQMNALWALVSLLMYLIGYFGIRQPEIFAGEAGLSPIDEPEAKYQRSTLTGDKADTIAQQLAVLMDTDKLYLVNDLTLASLAARLQISTHHLSQVLNERLGCSFFDYVNKFRVREAQRLLEDCGHNHLTLAAIGFEAGFNSVSAFNAIFKKVTSQTPSQYRSSR